MSLSVLGVGLPRTGTASLVRALEILGLRAIHYHPERLVDAVWQGNLRVYDDVDAAADFPAALQYRELLHLYPGLRCILTTREPREEWLDSVEAHGRQLSDWIGDDAYLAFVRRIADAWWGGKTHTRERLAARYEWWVDDVRWWVPMGQLLVMDIPAGDGWDPLCEFLGLPVPMEDFPWENRKQATSL